MPVQLPPNSTGTNLRTVDNAGTAYGNEREVMALSNLANALINPATEDTLALIRTLLAGAATEATALNIRRALTDYESRLDYDVRTDGNPVYVGKNAQGTATSAATWTIQRLEYDGSNRLTRAQVLTGSWTGRAALGWS